MRGLPIISLGIFLTLGAGATHAEDSIKKNVFSDCAAAERGLSSLEGEKRSEFVSYLGRVLELDASALQGLFSESPELGGRTPLLEITNFPAIESRKEIEAKRCALQILGLLGAESVQTIPSIASFSLRPEVPFQLRVQASQVLWSVVDRVPELSTEILRFFLSELSTERDWLADHIFTASRKSAIPFLFESLEDLKPKLRSRVVQTIERIDPDGVYSRPLLPTLLRSADSDLRLRGVQILGALQTVEISDYDLLIQRLSDSQPEVSEAATRAVGRLNRLETPVSGSLSDSQAELILREWKSRDEQGRELLDGVLLRLGRGNSAIAQELHLNAQSSSDKDLRVRAVRLLPQIDPTESFDEIEKYTFDPDSQVRLAAIDALGSYLGREQQIVGALHSLLKASSRVSDRNLRERIVLAAMPILATRSGNQGLQPFKTYLLDALSLPSFGQIVDKERVQRMIVSLGSDAFPALIKLLKQSNPSLRLTAVEVLSEIKGLELRQVRELFSVLSDADPSVSRAALRALDLLLPADTGEIQRALKTAPVTRKLSLSLLLLKRDPLSSEGLEIVREYAPKSRCDDALHYTNFLGTVSAKEPFLLRLIECSLSGDVTIANLAELTFLSSPSLSTVQRALWESLGRAEAKLADQVTALLIAMRSEGILDPVGTSILLRLLNVGENAEREKLLRALGERELANPEVRAVIEKLFSDSAGERALRGLAAGLLLRINLGHEESRQHLLSELKRERYLPLLGALDLLPPESRREIFESFLGEVEGERLVFLIREIGSLGEVATKSVDRLLPFTEDENPLVRYQTVLALLRINPSLEQLPKLLRQEIRGKYYTKLFGERLPIKAGAPIRELLNAPNNPGELQPLSAGERIQLESLLRAIPLEQGL